MNRPPDLDEVAAFRGAGRRRRLSVERRERFFKAGASHRFGGRAGQTDSSAAENVRQDVDGPPASADDEIGTPDSANSPTEPRSERRPLSVEHRRKLVNAGSRYQFSGEPGRPPSSGAEDVRQDVDGLLPSADDGIEPSDAANSTLEPQSGGRRRELA